MCTPVSDRESGLGYASWPTATKSNQVVGLLLPTPLVVDNQIVPQCHRKGGTDLTLHIPLHRDTAVVRKVAVVAVHTEVWEFPLSRQGGWVCRGCYCFPFAVGGERYLQRPGASGTDLDPRAVLCGMESGNQLLVELPQMQWLVSE